MVGNSKSLTDGNPRVMHCSNCGFKGGKKELNVREWTCLNCGTLHDRDLNAAINILEVVQPKAKVETQAIENPIQLSLFAEVAVRVASRREGAQVDYLSDTEEVSDAVPQVNVGRMSMSNITLRKSRKKL
ncbi:zinc ribbon domain-containing protein [Okeania sp. SIO3I5]|uniref:zinc ribbon domain-containing protein n=1 Tax=Okeania sp. SIO3I5 TaxID=2607805 RepID=UPI0025F76E62|nr:zinc ribbon domain-containing protein [Okeania sp. SIO3I5]